MDIFFWSYIADHVVVSVPGTIDNSTDISNIALGLHETDELVLQIVGGTLAPGGVYPYQVWRPLIKFVNTFYENRGYYDINLIIQVG